MNATEIQSKIQFTVEDHGDYLQMTASLGWKRALNLSRIEMEMRRVPPDLLLDEVKAKLKERFLRDLYEDQSLRLRDALCQLAHRPPGLGNYAEWRAGVLAVLEIARRQPPPGVLPEGPDV